MTLSERLKAKKQTEKTARKHTSEEFKDQALKRAEKDGVALSPRTSGSPKPRSIVLGLAILALKFVRA